jgi:hypothetical protein
MIYFEIIITFRNWEVVFLEMVSVVVIVMGLIWERTSVYNLEHS